MELKPNMGGGQYLDWIATLRGIAAMLVFISHLSLGWPTSVGFVIGRIGVTMFFLMSEYLTVAARKKGIVSSI